MTWARKSSTSNSRIHFLGTAWKNCHLFDHPRSYLLRDLPLFHQVVRVSLVSKRSKLLSKKGWSNSTQTFWDIMCGLVLQCESLHNPRSEVTDSKLPVYFCLLKFGSKYAWERHKSTVHELQVVWIWCNTVYKPSDYNLCILCSEILPTTKELLDHLATDHKIRDCTA